MDANTEESFLCKFMIPETLTMVTAIFLGQGYYPSIRMVYIL